MDAQASDRLYEQFVKPLEDSHRGQYASVSLQGEIVLAPTLIDALQRGAKAFGKDNSIVFHVGNKVVGRLRSPWMRGALTTSVERA